MTDASGEPAPAAPVAPGAPAAGSRWRPWHAVALVAGVAALVRGIRLPEVLSGVEGLWHTYDQTDSFTFEMWAREILGGNWLLADVPRPPHEWERLVGTPEDFARWEGPNALRHAPLYSYLLAGIYGIFGHEAGLVLGSQFLIGIGWAVATLALTRRVFGPAAGLAAGIGAALYGPAVYLEGLLLRDAPALLLHVGGLLLLARGLDSRRARTLVAAGLSAGALVLLKEAAAPLALAAVAWLAWEGLAGKVPGFRRAAGLVALGGVLALLPLFARNVATGAPPCSLSTRIPVSLALANAPDTEAHGLIFEATPGGAGILRTSGGGGLATAAEVLRSAPVGPLLGGYVLRLIALLTPFEGPDNANWWHFRGRSRVLPFLLVFPCLAGPALVGIVLAWGRRRALPPVARLLLLEIGFLLLLVPLGNPQCRYRIMLVPLLLPFAGLAVAEAAAALRAGGRGRALRIAAGALAAAGIASACERVLQAGPRTLHDWRHRPADHETAARLLAAGGRLDEALGELDSGLGIFRVPSVRHALSVSKVRLLLRAGETERARREARRWAESEPNPGWAAWYRDLGMGPPPRGCEPLALPDRLPQRRRGS